MNENAEKIAQISALINTHSIAINNKEVSSYSIGAVIEAANKIAETIVYETDMKLQAAKLAVKQESYRGEECDKEKPPFPSI